MVFSRVDQKYTKETIGPKVSEKVLFVLIVFSETTGPIGIKFSRNVYLMVLWKVNVFFLVDQKYIKETRGPKVSKRVLFVLIVFSETTGSIGTKFGRNVYLMVLWEVNVFLGCSEVHKRNQRPKGVSNYVVWFFLCYSYSITTNLNLQLT